MYNFKVQPGEDSEAFAGVDNPVTVGFINGEWWVKRNLKTFSIHESLPEALKDINREDILDKILYTGIFLTEESAKALQDHPRVMDAIKALQDPKIICHHMTLAFEPSRLHIESLPFGSKVSLVVVGIADDEKAVAVEVRISDGSSITHGQNPAPHVTVACAKGTSPKYSNKLLGRRADPLDGKYFTVFGPQLEGVVAFFLKGKNPEIVF